MKDFNPSKGIIVYNDFNLDLSKPIIDQKNFLKEDLLQISFLDNYLLDLGWYPEGNTNGKFVLHIIKDFDWEKPILKKEINYGINIYKEINDTLELFS